MRELREDRGRSLRSLERATLSSKSKLHKIETGATVPSPETAQLIDNALEAGGELVAMVRRETTTVLPRSEFRGASAAVSALQTWSETSRIGDELPDQLLLNTARLRRLDDYVGGADTFATFTSEVTATSRLLRSGSYRESTGRRLLAVLAEQAQLAGWAAFDAGWQIEAHGLFAMSMEVAKDANDVALTANAMAFIGYQRLMLGRSAVSDLVEATETADGRVTPTVRALLHCRRAWAHANEGDADETQRHLDIAQAALHDADGGPEPDWVYWVNDLEHEIMTGRCWTALRRPIRAIAVLERVMQQYQDTHGRDKALYLSFLADAYLDANELEQACAVASRALDLSAGIGSIRPRMRLEAVIGRIDGSAPYVKEIRAKALEWASLRQLSAAPMSGTPLIPSPMARQ